MADGRRRLQTLDRRRRPPWRGRRRGRRGRGRGRLPRVGQQRRRGRTVPGHLEHHVGRFYGQVDRLQLYRRTGRLQTKHPNQSFTRWIFFFFSKNRANPASDSGLEQLDSHAVLENQVPTHAVRCNGRPVFFTFLGFIWDSYFFTHYRERENNKTVGTEKWATTLKRAIVSPR